MLSSDSNMTDSPEIVLEDFLIILEELKQIGLSVNISKCELTCIHFDYQNTVIKHYQQALPEIRITSTDDSIILRSPIVTNSVMSDINSKKSLKLMISRLNLIDPHQALLFLKNSFAIPNLAYPLRSAPTPAYHQADLFQEFYKMLRDLW